MANRNLLYVLNSTGVGGAEKSIKRMCEGWFQEATVVTLFGHVNTQEGFWNLKFKGRYKQLCDSPISIFNFFLYFLRWGCSSERTDFRQCKVN